MVGAALAIMQSDQLPWGWGQLAMFGPTIVILVLLLGFMLKMAPLWKELKLRELNVREEEAKSRAEQAVALRAVAQSLETLGRSLNQNTELLSNVAVIQRQATESVRLLQRANSRSAEQLETVVHEVSARVREIEERHAKNSGATTH